MEVRSLVSDRAQALEKLGEAGYLQVCSMPDLFHYQQEIGKSVGCRLGKQLERAQKAVAQAKESAKQEVKEALESIEKIYQSYREQIEGINKLIHPFNEQNEWVTASVIEKGLLHSLRSINTIAEKANLEIAIDKAGKIFAQISPIAQGVQNWIDFTKTDLDTWQTKQIISPEEKQWLITFTIPYVYWQIQLNRTQAKAKNKNLRNSYQQRIEKAQEKWEDSCLKKELPTQRLEFLMAMAYQIAISFQRASSQTEGRNGYLAFVNHAHRGMSNDRLKVLTVIHNYDIRRIDGTTPAQRLFGKEFPDLFEFLCQNVTGFKEPRVRKRNSLFINNLQR